MAPPADGGEGVFRVTKGTGKRGKEPVVDWKLA